MLTTDAATNLKDGDILAADRAYTDFKFLCLFALRGVFYVVRWKRNIQLEVVAERPVDPLPENERSMAKVRVKKDVIVRPAKAETSVEYSAGGGTLRRITAKVVSTVDTNSGGSCLPSRVFVRRQTEPTEILRMTTSSAVTFPKSSI